VSNIRRQALAALPDEQADRDHSDQQKWYRRWIQLFLMEEAIPALHPNPPMLK
jgi:hypothetical protein